MAGVSCATMLPVLPRQSGEGRKQFFFEKKNQKTFVLTVPHSPDHAKVPAAARTKSFTFFRKEESFL
jgi:hypothetical protein